MSAGRIVLVVVGSLLALIGLGLTAAGGTLVWAQAQRDADGYFATSSERFGTTTFALVSDRVDLDAEGWDADWADEVGDLARVRVRAVSADPARPLFVGIGPAADVETYLAGVAHDEVSDVDFDPFEVTYARRPGLARPAPPAAQGFWVARVRGAGTQTLEWDLASGEWALVVMDGSGARGVAADVSLGVRVDALVPIAVTLLAVGLILLAGGTTMVALGARGGPAAAPTATGVAGAPPGPVAAATGYPVRLGGALDPGLSRWLWLVKWVLVIPHVLVLIVLWLAFTVLTVVAWFAILATGRYPRGIFDFNVGVMRWTWRVAFYAYGALGTDRYPPFTLAPTDHPAELDVAYPEHLHRGLALVKWWLLAVPHYIVLGIFGTGLWWSAGWAGSGGWGDWGWGAWGGGLLGVLVLFAGVCLLVVGRYPRDIFRLVMGVNRWSFRVLAYSALMRDEYPPFRLDAEEPPPAGEVRGAGGGG